MNLRIRLQAELSRRLSAHLPQAMATVWDHASVVIVIEQLTYKPAGGSRGDWAFLTAFSGIVRAELRADEIDALPVEALICDLVRDPIQLLPDPETAPGGLTEAARIILAETRDHLRDTDVATGLRFSVEGHIMGRARAPDIPNAVMLGQSPAIGPGHQDNYDDMRGLA
ncbi:MAG: hypothetical protein Q4G26_16450 [Paracoccus sp. (in: a-proteobacteria)]|nr:hypothetical protein [Paracoccus sp. (in: a-proteobacteria)]